MPIPTTLIKRVVAMTLAEKNNEGLIFENCTGDTVNNILPDDKAFNEDFIKIDRNIAGVEWEAEIQEAAVHMSQLNNNQYVSLAGKKDDEENDNKSTGVENEGEIEGVLHNDKIVGVDSHNESTESGSTESTDKAD